MSRRGLACALGVVLLGLLPGCFGDDPKKGDSASRSTSTAPGPGAKPGEPKEAAIIRAWSQAVSAGQFDKAASYFARNAVVVQAGPIKLTDHSAAVAFNKSLPCKSVVTDVKDEGKTVLAAFRLVKGNGSATSCDGPARVRFTFSGTKFKVWRQLSEPAAPSGDTA